MKFPLIYSLIMITSLFNSVLSAQTATHTMTLDLWREDLNQLSTTVKEIHFKPFHNITEQEFDESVARLEQNIAALNDAEIIVEMAKIIATLNDGHSRLHIPRLYPEFALEAELGHSGTTPPNFEELKFHQSPLQFQLFDDGVFVIAATSTYQNLIGHRVVALDSTPIDEALDLVKSVCFFENESRAKLMAPDRLALPQVTTALGITDAIGNIEITTEDSLGSLHETRLLSLSHSGESFVDKKTVTPLWMANRNEYRWYEVLEDQDAIYVQVNEFEEAPVYPYSDFVAETLAAARAAGVSRYIVDLRHNSGGIGAWVTPFVTGIAPSEFNDYGRLYVLMGRTTFSAAQTFLHRFEELTQAYFVGEPSGAKPSHFGDSQRVVLENSGLTLRMSTIYWQSWLGNDFRDTINPHLSVAYNAEHYFSGEDPVLEAALTYVPNSSLADEIEKQFVEGKNQNALLLYQRYIIDGSIEDHRQIIPELLVMAERLIQNEMVRQGYFIYFLINQSYPGDADLEADLERVEAML